MRDLLKKSFFYVRRLSTKIQVSGVSLWDFLVVNWAFQFYANQSVNCSVFTSPFSIGSTHLEPRWRRYQRKHQVPDGEGWHWWCLWVYLCVCRCVCGGVMQGGKGLITAWKPFKFLFTIQFSRQNFWLCLSSICNWRHDCLPLSKGSACRGFQLQY